MGCCHLPPPRPPPTPHPLIRRGPHQGHGPPTPGPPAARPPLTRPPPGPAGSTPRSPSLRGSGQHGRWHAPPRGGGRHRALRAEGAAASAAAGAAAATAAAGVPGFRVQRCGSSWCPRAYTRLPTSSTAARSLIRCPDAAAGRATATADWSRSPPCNPRKQQAWCWCAPAAAPATAGPYAGTRPASACLAGQAVPAAVAPPWFRGSGGGQRGGWLGGGGGGDTTSVRRHMAVLSGVRVAGGAGGAAGGDARGSCAGGQLGCWGAAAAGAGLSGQCCPDAPGGPCRVSSAGSTKDGRPRGSTPGGRWQCWHPWPGTGLAGSRLAGWEGRGEAGGRGKHSASAPPCYSRRRRGRRR